MVKGFCNLFLLVLVAVVCNCLSDSDDDKLTFTRTPYDGSALKLNGYYYRTFKDGDIEIYFFYQNGNVLLGGGVSPRDLQWMEEMFQNGTYYNKYAKDDKTLWGVFRITGNIIEYERWVSPNGMSATPAYRYTGTILNDTTFQTHSDCRVDGTDENAYDYVFKFKQFTPKPDSVTQFIP